MDITVLFSPTHGFWSETGWQDWPSHATRIPSTAHVQIGFKNTRDVRRVRLLACEQLTPLELLRWLINLLARTQRHELAQSIKQLYKITHLPSPDDLGWLQCMAKQVPMAKLARLASTHSHYDVYVGHRLDDVIMIARDEAVPIERAPLIPPFIEVTKEPRRNHSYKSTPKRMD